MKYSIEEIKDICDKFQGLVEEFEQRSYSNKNIPFGTSISRVGTNKEWTLSVGYLMHPKQFVTKDSIANAFLELVD